MTLSVVLKKMFLRLLRWPEKWHEKMNLNPYRTQGEAVPDLKQLKWGYREWANNGDGDAWQLATALMLIVEAIFLFAFISQFVMWRWELWLMRASMIAAITFVIWFLTSFERRE